jgi:hypothetical protein
MNEANCSYLMEILANNCNPPFSLKDKEIKIRSAIERSRRRERNIHAEVEEWVSVTTGDFSVTEWDKDGQCVTKAERGASRKAFQRLKEAGIIERTGKKNGIYRRVENKAEVIDIFSDTGTAMELKWPLGIEGMVNILPKSIIVIAGESDAGKTAYCLAFSYLNMGKFKIQYFSSEMGATELRDRLSKFDCPFEEWRAVTFKERSGDFADVVVPDDINVVDYLEMSDEFYKVGGQIKAIFDKLNKGIAIICLQKKIGSEFGRGGDFSMEKSRLYMSLSRDNICKILKAKNWANPRIKPTGKWKRYALLDGCKFLAKSNWMMEGQEDEKD